MRSKRLPAKLPAALCPRCSRAASRGALQLVQLMTADLAVEPTRRLRDLLAQQAAAEARADGRLIVIAAVVPWIDRASDPFSDRVTAPGPPARVAAVAADWTAHSFERAGLMRSGEMFLAVVAVEPRLKYKRKPVWSRQWVLAVKVDGTSCSMIVAGESILSVGVENDRLKVEVSCQGSFHNVTIVKAMARNALAKDRMNRNGLCGETVANAVTTEERTPAADDWVDVDWAGLVDGFQGYMMLPLPFVLVMPVVAHDSEPVLLVRNGQFRQLVRAGNNPLMARAASDQRHRFKAVERALRTEGARGEVFPRVGRLGRRARARRAGPGERSQRRGGGVPAGRTCRLLCGPSRCEPVAPRAAGAGGDARVLGAPRAGPAPPRRLRGEAGPLPGRGLAHGAGDGARGRGGAAASRRHALPPLPPRGFSGGHPQAALRGARALVLAVRREWLTGWLPCARHDRAQHFAVEEPCSPRSGDDVGHPRRGGHGMFMKLLFWSTILYTASAVMLTASGGGARLQVLEYALQHRSPQTLVGNVEEPSISAARKRVAWADTYDTDFLAKAPAAAADTIGKNMPAANSFEPIVDPIELGTGSRLSGSSCHCVSNPALPSEATFDSFLHTFGKRTLSKLDEKFLAGFELLSASNAKHLPTPFATSVKPVMDSLQSQVAKEIIDIRSGLGAAYDSHILTLGIREIADEKLLDTVDQILKLIEVDTKEMQQHIDSIEQHVQFLQGHEQYPDNRDGSPNVDNYFDTLLTHVKRDDCRNGVTKILNSLPEPHSGGWHSSDCQPPASGIQGTAVADSPKPLTQSETTALPMPFKTLTTPLPTASAELNFDEAADAEATQSETDELLTPSGTYELQQQIAYELELDEIEFNSELERVEPKNVCYDASGFLDIYFGSLLAHIQKVDCCDDCTKVLDSIDLRMPQPGLKQQTAYELAPDELEPDGLQQPPAYDELDEFDERALQSEFGQLFSPSEIDEFNRHFESDEFLRGSTCHVDDGGSLLQAAADLGSTAPEARELAGASEAAPAPAAGRGGTLCSLAPKGELAPEVAAFLRVTANSTQLERLLSQEWVQACASGATDAGLVSQLREVVHAFAVAPSAAPMKTQSDKAVQNLSREDPEADCSVLRSQLRDWGVSFPERVLDYGCGFGDSLAAMGSAASAGTTWASTCRTCARTRTRSSSSSCSWTSPTPAPSRARYLQGA
ncbi:unnamed protein product [Prorocentrum cordatum]|uniref:Uncharacterized protein n=1 Tax=Prorocentrum cordatum TaxID=2364126 RepID=A0ABN9UL95_9DINO|nr:unnamed protein product [Polarella glacialis]